jgi:SAM-dependent methyltransferase
VAESPSDPRFWREHYARSRQGWELGRAAPPLERWFDEDSPRGRRTLVLGCGRGHEARLLAARGATVTAVDFVGEALAEARQLAAAEGLAIDFRERDLFDLPRDPERYDLVVEHCCYCAIDPARRADYVEVVANLLIDGGELVALFWAHGRPGGPPFSVDGEEIERLFTRRFVLTEMTVPADSVERRRGQELLAIFRRR